MRGGSGGVVTPGLISRKGGRGGATPWPDLKKRGVGGVATPLAHLITILTGYAPLTHQGES